MTAQRPRPLWIVVAVALAVGLAGGLAACAPARPDPDRPQWAQPERGRAVMADLAPVGVPLGWQWQLSGELDLTVDASVFDLDAFSTQAATVNQLHATSRLAICYVNAGVYEDFRPDAGRYPPEVLGVGTGWAGERWIDIRRWDVLGPILADRFALCKGKGFDAVDADNVDGYRQPTGFSLTGADQLTFNRRIADLAHEYRLGVGLKNDLAQAGTLEPHFDFAINEECFRYAECDRLAPFISAGKPVFHVEYELDTSQFCPAARERGFSSMRKSRELDAWRVPC